MNRLQRQTEIETDQMVVASSKSSLLQHAWEGLLRAARNSVQRAANAPLLHPRCCRMDRGVGGAR